MEDDKCAILETELAQAKQIAEEADKKYEEVNFLAQEIQNKLKGKIICFLCNRGTRFSSVPLFAAPQLHHDIFLSSISLFHRYFFLKVFGEY